MKAIYFLATFCYFVSCGAQNESEVTEYCVEQCKNKCIPCNEPIECTKDQTDCGLDKPDPAFGGVCPAHAICVPTDYNCKYTVILEIYVGNSATENVTSIEISL
jgi:hypothetical protein